MKLTLREFLTENEQADAARRAAGRSVFAAMLDKILSTEDLTDLFDEVADPIGSTSGDTFHYLGASVGELTGEHDYNDLWVIFEPTDARRPDAGGFSHKLKISAKGREIEVPAIMLAVLNINQVKGSETEDGTAIKKILSHQDLRNWAESTFVHEFTHYLDYKRTGKQKWDQITNRRGENPVDSVSQAPDQERVKQAMQKYHSNPQEYDSWYQQSVSQVEKNLTMAEDDIEDFLQGDFFSPDEMGKAAILLKALKEFFGDGSFESFFEQLKHTNPHVAQATENMDEKYLRKFEKRFATYFQTSVQPRISKWYAALGKVAESDISDGSGRKPKIVRVR